MPVMRVNRNKNYTTMSNVHLRDLNLSLKARGLLSTILSLPDNWNYSIGGLASICKESETCIKSGLKELKEAGYMVIEKLYSDESETKNFKYIYNVFENPDDSKELREKVEKKKAERASRGGNPPVETPPMETPQVEGTPLYKSTDILSTDKINTDLKNTDSNKVFSQEEKTNYNKAFSGEKAYRSPDISYEYTEKEFKEFITKKVDHIVKEISPEEYDTSVEPISAIIAYFYKRYYKCMGKRHPILTDAVYTKIIMKLIEPVEDVWKRDFCLDKTVYYAMIDQFFKTDYGVKSGNITDYRMSYFMSDTVQSNLVYRSGIV